MQTKMISPELNNHIPQKIGQKPRILIIEDDPQAQDILSIQLTHFGYENEYVSDGFAALDWLSENTVDLIILDLMLPGMDGLEVCRRIRKQRSLTSLPILMISAKGNDTRLRIEGLQAGANDFIAKPYHPIELVARLKNLLQLSIQNHSHEVQILNQFSKAIISIDDLQHLLGMVAQVACEIIGTTSAYVCDMNFQTQTSTVLAEYFNIGASSKERVSDLNATYSIELGCSELSAWLQAPPKEIVCHVDDPNLAPVERDEMLQYGGKSKLLIPLIAESQVLGYIEVWESRQKRTFASGEILLIKAIANQAAITLRNLNLHQVVQDREHQQSNVRKIITSTTHDLKTPISTTNLCLALMSKQSDDPEKIRQHLLTIAAQMQRLEATLDDMLTQTQPTETIEQRLA